MKTVRIFCDLQNTLISVYDDFVTRALQWINLRKKEMLIYYHSLNESF